MKFLGRQPNCAAEVAKAKAVSEGILGQHERAQKEFDRVEGTTFESRITRLLRYRMESIENGQLPSSALD